MSHTNLAYNVLFPTKNTRKYFLRFCLKVVETFEIRFLLIFFTPYEIIFNNYLMITFFPL